jgi:hypothetical protein
MTKAILAFYIGVKVENPNTGLFDRLVCWATRSRYSHVEIVTQYVKEIHTGTCWSSSPRDGGVRMAIIPFKKTSWDLYEVDVDLDEERILVWFRKHQGKKYDWVGAFATTIPFLPQMFSRWFCSEAISASLGIHRPSRNTPEKLYQHVKKTAVAIKPS